MGLKVHPQDKTHPFRRYIPRQEENERDEWVVITHANFNGNKAGSPQGNKGGGGK